MAQRTVTISMDEKICFALDRAVEVRAAAVPALKIGRSAIVREALLAHLDVVGGRPCHADNQNTPPETSRSRS